MSRRVNWLPLGTMRIALVGTVAIVACEPERPVETDTAREPVVRLTPEVPQPVEPAREQPFQNFDLPEVEDGLRPIVRHPVRIENGMTQQIVVAATAGAAPIVLDTLDPGDQLRVDLDAPADRLELQWTTIDGGTSGATPVEVLPDSVLIVRIAVGSVP